MDNTAAGLTLACLTLLSGCSTTETIRETKLLPCPEVGGLAVQVAKPSPATARKNSHLLNILDEYDAALDLANDRFVEIQAAAADCHRRAAEVSRPK